MQTGTSLLLPDVVCVHGCDFFAFSFPFFGEVFFPRDSILGLILLIL